jgi:endoglucanase
MNIFRVPFLMERLVPSSITGNLDATYLSDLKKVGPRLRHLLDGMRCLFNDRPSSSLPAVVLMPFLILITMEDSKSWLVFTSGVVTNSTPPYSSGSIISSTSDFQEFWKTVASEFASNDKVIFDTSEIPNHRRPVVFDCLELLD